MTTINFTNSLGLTTAFTNHDLDLILTELNTHDSSFASGENQIGFIMLNVGYLLLVDLNTHFSRRLFEMFSFSASNLYPFQLKLTNNNSAATFSINEALVSVGYSGSTPINSLSQIFMQLYIQSGSNLSVYSKTEVDTMILNLIDHAPTNLDTLSELAAALNNLSTSEQNSTAALLLQIGTKLNITSPQYTGRLKNSDNTFSVDVSGNLICNDATFSGLISGIAVNDITGLQSLIDSKQPTITTNSLNISSVLNLQPVLNGLQHQITNDNVSVLALPGIQASIDSKQNTLTTNSVPISYVSGLQSLIDSKQGTVATNSLNIATISGLTNSLSTINTTFDNYYNKTHVDG